MTSFDKLYSEFENTKNVCEFYSKYDSNSVSTRFLLIRSLNKKHLQDIISKYSTTEPTSRIRDLTKLAYNSSVTIPQLLDYIEEQRTSLIKEREEELADLSNILMKIPIVNCGVRNDKVDDIVKSFVRNKTIKTYNELVEELDSNVLQRVRQYCLWSYYNQTSNDIIELFFLKHKKVIPTLRKIHDIDFFIKIGNKIIPFDLKFTHISDSYFDLASQGFITPSGTFDDYVVNVQKESELQLIRQYYNRFKREHREKNLTAASKLSKNELISFIASIGNAESTSFIKKVELAHANYVPNSSEKLKMLEWWNYKYQGERLFCNNNRLFVFLAYKNKFIDGRELKGKTDEIGKKINELLDSLDESSIHTIHYHYDKEAQLEANYTTLSLSTIYSE